MTSRSKNTDTDKGSKAKKATPKKTTKSAEAAAAEAAADDTVETVPQEGDLSQTVASDPASDSGATDNPTSAGNPQARNQGDVMYRMLDAPINIPVELLRKRHVFIATPCYGGQIGEPFFRSVIQLCNMLNKYEVPFSIRTISYESLIPRGRNTLVSYFMESKDATHLFFIDADIEFRPEDVIRMVAYDKPVIVGAYPKKAINWYSIIQAARNLDLNETPETIEGHSSNYVINFEFLKDEQGKPTTNVQIVDNLIRLKDAGTGFMCIKREVIAKMMEAHPELKYHSDLNIEQKYQPYMYALFDTMIDPESRRYLSEDYTFCRLWQYMGGEIYLDPRTALNHTGYYTFRGNIRKIFTGENSYHRQQLI